MKLNFHCSALFYTNTKVFVSYFGQHWMCKKCFAFNSPPGSFKRDFFYKFGQSNAFNLVLI